MLEFTDRDQLDYKELVLAGPNIAWLIRGCVCSLAVSCVSYMPHRDSKKATVSCEQSRVTWHSYSRRKVHNAVLQGNALLVGVGGSGKQSLAKLAAFMSGCEVFEITLTRGYDETMFREDLKQLYSLLGSDNKKVCSVVLNTLCTRKSICMIMMPLL